MSKPITSPKERFLSHIKVSDEVVDGIAAPCWVWQSCNMDDMSPQFNFGNGRNVSICNASWLLYFGEKSPGEIVCRRCATPRCVNPDHLYIGTKGDSRVSYVIQDNGVRTKECSVCKKRFPFTSDYFGKDCETISKLGPRCKSCAVKVTADSSVKHWIRLMLYRCKDSAEKKNLLFDLTEKDIEEIYEQQNGKCFWSGVPMMPSGIHRYPFKPSPDRLDRLKGYTKDNVVLCCILMNVGRNSCDLDVFLDAIKQYPEVFGSGLWTERFGA